MSETSGPRPFVYFCGTFIASYFPSQGKSFLSEGQLIRLDMNKKNKQTKTAGSVDRDVSRLILNHMFIDVS